MVAKNALLFAALLASSMLFAGMGDWDGQLFINGAAAADGTQVCAYVNGVENSRTTIGAYATGYYLMTIIGETGDNVTFNAFCDSQYPAKEGAQAWSASPPRHHLNLTIDYDSVIGNASNITSSGTGTLTMTINGSAPGNYYSDIQTVRINSSNGVVLSYNFDFSNDSLNLSGINITVGNSSGKSYISVSGVNASGGQSGTKTLTMYGVSSTYNGVCVEDTEAATYVGISDACTGTNEVQVTCNGVAVSGFTCSQSGTTLTISGLTNSAVMQFAVPATTTTTTTSTTGGSSGGGSSGGGSPSSTKKTDEYYVDLEQGLACKVTITRNMESTTTLSKLTTTLTNAGGESCAMQDFVFSDTMPSEFAGISEITFTPNYTSRSGQTATFAFPYFSPGESKTLTYSVSRWAKPSSVGNFTVYSMSGQKIAVPGSDRDEHGCIPSAGYSWCEEKQKCLRAWEEECTTAAPQPPQPPAQNQTGQPQVPQQNQTGPPPGPEPQKPFDLSPVVLAAFGVLVLAVIAAVGYMILQRRKKGLDGV